MSRQRAWFAAKTFGFGSGWPIAWQGWAVVVGFIAGMVLSGGYLTGWPRVLAFLGLTAALVLICSQTTEGGWRWRR